MRVRDETPYEFTVFWKDDGELEVIKTLISLSGGEVPMEFSSKQYTFVKDRKGRITFLELLKGIIQSEVCYESV